ncbi:Fc receptor-like protein 5 [Carettochelys insculpta]|uniref:Fc receptor-like protein 5 n=1 Tax=Carettochelys insculpta TaxID=44489 RepID=UPI003EBBCBE5
MLTKEAQLDKQEILREPPYSSHYSYTELLTLSGVSGSQSVNYTCVSWQTESRREIPSERSRAISIEVRARLPAPQLTVSPSYRVYLTGESVTLRCAAPGGTAVSGFRFFRDGQKINPKQVSSSWYSDAELIVLSGVSGSHTGAYTCEYWQTQSGREIPSQRSRAVTIKVRARPPATQLTVSPPYRVYLTGESVTLRCAATGGNAVSGFRFFRDRQEIYPKQISSPWYSDEESIVLSGVSGSHTGAYTCEYWKSESGRQIPSERSRAISIEVRDHPPPPELSLDPPSGVVSEGVPLLITCVAPRHTGEQRFHFYKDGAKFIPRDLLSETSTAEPSTSSRNVSVLRIPRAALNDTGTFTCEYEEKVNGRWLLSLSSQPVTVPVTDSHLSATLGFFWVRRLVVGGSFFLVNGLIFLLFNCCYSRPG